MSAIRSLSAGKRTLRKPRSTPLPRSTLFDPRNDPYALRGAATKRDDTLIIGSVGARRQGAKPITSDQDHDWIEDNGPRPKID